MTVCATFGVAHVRRVDDHVREVAGRQEAERRLDVLLAQPVALAELDQHRVRREQLGAALDEGPRAASDGAKLGPYCISTPPSLPAAASGSSACRKRRNTRSTRASDGSTLPRGVTSETSVPQVGRQLLGRHAVARHHPERLHVEDEAVRRAIGPARRGRGLGDRVVRRVHLDRVVVLGVEAQARLGALHASPGTSARSGPGRPRSTSRGGSAQASRQRRRRAGPIASGAARMRGGSTPIVGHTLRLGRITPMGLRTVPPPRPEKGCRAGRRPTCYAGSTGYGATTGWIHLSAEADGGDLPRPRRHHAAVGRGLAGDGAVPAGALREPVRAARGRTRGARRARRGARARSRRRSAARRREVVFTGGGSEADNLAVLGRLARRRARRRRRRSSTPPCASRCGRTRGEVAWAPVDGRRRRRPARRWRELVRPGDALCCVMGANNVTGALQPVAAIAALCAERGVPLHVDAVQAASGADVRALPGRTTLALAAHKLGGPKGVGALAGPRRRRRCRRSCAAAARSAACGPAPRTSPAPRRLAAALRASGRARRASERAPGACRAPRPAGARRPACPSPRPARRACPATRCCSRGVRGDLVVHQLDGAGICVAAGLGLRGRERRAVLRARGDGRRRRRRPAARCASRSGRRPRTPTSTRSWPRSRRRAPGCCAPSESVA